MVMLALHDLNHVTLLPVAAFDIQVATGLTEYRYFDVRAIADGSDSYVVLIIV